MGVTCLGQQSPCLGNVAGVQVFKIIIEAAFRPLGFQDTEKNSRTEDTTSLLPSQKPALSIGEGTHAQNLTYDTATANLLSLIELFLNPVFFGHGPNDKLFLNGILKK